MPARGGATKSKKKPRARSEKSLPEKKRSSKRSRGAKGAAGVHNQPRPEDLARVHFGVTRLRPFQKEAIEALLSGRNVVAVLPTGAGKSLLYQVPTLALAQPTVVVSPLLALMRDQEEHLLRCRVPVVRLDSTVGVKARREALARIAAGGPLVILTTPETLSAPDLFDALSAGKPALLCVDEAHCISEWGHDFRPAYLRIGTQRARLKIPRSLALTATATDRVRREIASRLRLKRPVEIVAPPHRPNLRLSCHCVPGSLKIERAGRILRKLRRPGIVYCATKKAVDEIYGALVRARIPCSRYHGGMTAKDRAQAQADYMRRGRRTVMVATPAFGMGIDKPDIRYIAHYQVPGSLEQYVQEAGRAGRDGRPAECILLYDPSDLRIQQFLQEKSRPNPSQLRRVVVALKAWVEQHRSVAAKDLALAARVPATVCKALTGELEHAGLLQVVGRDHRISALVAGEKVEVGGLQIAKKFEIQRREDERRLHAIAHYAESSECRSVVIRRWFGEATPPLCGHCDNCRSAAAVSHRRPRSKSGRASRA